MNLTFTGFKNICKNNKLELVQSFYENGFNINTKDKYKRNGFSYACEGGALEVIKFLIETCQCNMNELDKFGKNGFLYACENGHINVIKYLLLFVENDIDVQDKRGMTGFLFACKLNYFSILKLLIKHKCNIFLV